MTPPLILDASVLIAAMNPTDAHYRKAVALLRRGAIAGGLVAHPITIAESAVGAADHGRLDQLKSAYAGLGVITAEGDSGQPWRLAQLRAETRLPLPDCCVLDTAMELAGQLATFDARLATAADAHGIALVPT